MWRHSWCLANVWQPMEKTPKIDISSHIVQLGPSLSLVCVCVLLKIANKKLISVATLFSDNLDIKVITTTRMNTSDLYRQQTRCFAFKMAKSHSEEHFAFLYSYLASHERKQPAITTCFWRSCFAWQQGFKSCAKISLCVKSTFPTALAVYIPLRQMHSLSIPLPNNRLN